MDKILDVIKSPIFWLVVSAISGIVLRRIADRWKALIYFLTTQIKIFDEEVADIIPDEHIGKITRMNRMVKHNISPKMKKKLDEVLIKQGFIGKKKRVYR